MDAENNDETEMLSSDRPDPSGAGPSHRATDDPSGAETEPSVAGPAEPFTDVVPASSAAAEPTIAAPSFRAPVDQQGESHKLRLGPGEKIDDFEVLEVLGRGAFGVVYLARQVSLDRRVALKVAENRGSEGRTMARLEHDHVVQVFSESVDDSGRYRLLCMQLVPGASLEAVIHSLRETARDKGEWSGADYLAAVDSKARVSDVFDPSALRDREMIDNACDVETSAWVGARLAEAVDFAHANEVLHRDIKPANVLVNQYGRPLLADFNISFRALRSDKGDDPSGGGDDKQSNFGGTLLFMAPEHLEAFDPEGESTPDDVDERSDLYSLGIVIYEMLMGRLPFNDPGRVESRTRYFGKLAEWRRIAPAPIEAGPPSARKVLQHTLARSLAGKKEDRFQSGEQFAAALDGARRLAQVDRTAPAPAAFTRLVARRPLLWAVLLIFVPQVLGSLVNISYNLYQIADLLNQRQGELFWKLVLGYNAVVYPAALATLIYFFRPVFGMWRRLQESDRIDAGQVAAARRASLRLPLWVLAAAAVGWLPGGLLFPTMIHWLEPTVDAHVFMHFITSFTFSGLIAVAYSFGGMQYVVLRVLYPRLWTDATSFQSVARRELSGTTWRLWFIEIAAYAVPVVGMFLVSLLLKDNSGIPLFTLVSSLAVLGLAGTALIRIATSVMARMQVALTGQS